MRLQKKRPVWHMTTQRYRSRSPKRQWDSKKDQYSVLGDLLSQVFGASEKDVANIIDAAKYGKDQEKQDAQNVIDRAIKLADLSNSTPAGVTYDIGGTKVVGQKTSSGSGFFMR